MSEVVTQTVADVEVRAERGRSAGTRAVSRRNEQGMVSAEWAVGLIAAIAIAGVLLAVVTNGAVKGAILQFILTVIHAFSGGIGRL